MTYFLFAQFYKTPSSLILLIFIHFVFFFKGKPSGWDNAGKPEE